MRCTPLVFLLLSAACGALPSSPDVWAGSRRAAALVGADDAADGPPAAKAFHHVYAPDGRLLTKGDGGSFPHHRGLFIGWNRTTSAGQAFDFWHLNRGERQRFAGYADPRLLDLPAAAQAAHIEWCAPDGSPVVAELRGLAAAEDGGDAFVLHVRTELRAARHPVVLDGDPQHSGHQFRALQRFAEEGATKVAYVYPEGAVAHDNDVWTGCDWIAAVLPLPDGPITVLRVESRRNPPDPRWSTRPYGRFGATFAIELRPGEPCALEWWYVVAAEARDAAWCANTAARLRDR